MRGVMTDDIIGSWCEPLFHNEATFSDDTVCAVVAEARLGIPQNIAIKIWAHLPHDMRQVMTALHNHDSALAG